MVTAGPAIKEGIWRKSEPQEGEITPREWIASIGKWRVNVWVKFKRSAQIFSRPGEKNTFNLFFPTRDEAISFIASPYLGLILLGIDCFLTKCKWKKASVPGKQKWMDF
jgi:hypothetical protein